MNDNVLFGEARLSTVPNSVGLRTVLRDETTGTGTVDSDPLVLLADGKVRTSAHGKGDSVGCSGKVVHESALDVLSGSDNRVVDASVKIAHGEGLDGIVTSVVSLRVLGGEIAIVPSESFGQTFAEGLDHDDDRVSCTDRLVAVSAQLEEASVETTHVTARGNVLQHDNVLRVDNHGSKVEVTAERNFSVQVVGVDGHVGLVGERLDGTTTGGDQNHGQ